MILGTGIDIVDLARIRHIWRKFGGRFCRHILAECELAALPGNPEAFLGARFAAKEAAAKALGTGFAHGIRPTQIATGNDPQGRPVLSLSGAALLRANELGARKYHVSLSHERGLAVALVLLED